MTSKSGTKNDGIGNTESDTGKVKNRWDLLPWNAEFENVFYGKPKIKNKTNRNEKE